MGVSGCGKTTVGLLLAQRLSAIFLDADDFHPVHNVAKMRDGIALDDADRVPWLATLNHELHTRQERGEWVVLACSALKARYRDAIAANFSLVDWVFLDGSFELIAARMRARAGHYMPESLLRSQFEALERPLDAIILSVELEVEAMVDHVLVPLFCDRVARP